MGDKRRSLTNKSICLIQKLFTKRFLSELILFGALTIWAGMTVAQEVESASGTDFPNFGIEQSFENAFGRATIVLGGDARLIDFQHNARLAVVSRDCLSVFESFDGFETMFEGDEARLDIVSDFISYWSFLEGYSLSKNADVENVHASVAEACGNSPNLTVSQILELVLED